MPDKVVVDERSERAFAAYLDGESVSVLDASG